MCKGDVITMKFVVYEIAGMRSWISKRDTGVSYMKHLPCIVDGRMFRLNVRSCL